MTKQPNGDFHADYVETYVVGAAVAEVHQRLAVFLPDPTDFPPPVEGYPIILATSFAGFATSSYGTIVPLSASPVLAYRQLNELGIAFAWMGNTGSYSDLAGTLNTTSNGRGLFHPPQTAGWDDDLRYSGQKEAILAVQLIRERAGTWGVDPNRIMVDGLSAGSVAVACPTFWPDQGDATKTDHRRQSSRVLAARLGISQTDFGIYDPAIGPPANFNMFPDAGGDITTDLAPTYGAAPAGYLRWSSALRIGFDDAVNRARNAHGVHIWNRVVAGGENMSDLTLSGEWTETTGKVPTDAENVDANDPGALHENGSAVLLTRALREIEFDGWHTKRSRLVYDSAGYDYVVALEPALAGMVNHVLPYAPTDPDIQDVELAWISGVFFPLSPEVPIEDLPPVDGGGVVDVGINFGVGGGDLELSQGDLVRETGLRTAILVSLFSDARAPEDLALLPDGSNDPRGWWAEDSGDPFGSLLWLEDRGKVTDESAEKMRSAAENGLAWLVSEGLASAVRVRSVLTRGETPRVELAIEIDRSDAVRWSGIWDALELETFTSPDLRVTFAF